MAMKRSHWFLNCSTPDDRYFAARFLQRCRNRFVKESAPLYHRMVENINRRLLYFGYIEQVLQRERELQTATVIAVDPSQFDAEDVLHLDCNVLRTWPDRFLDVLIPFFDYKADRCKDFSVYDYTNFFYESAALYKHKRRLYEQASIKLKRERDRRKRVYNLS